MALGGGTREFVLKIVGDVTDATKAIDQVGNETQSMKDKMIGVGKSVATGLAVGAVVQFGRSAVQSAQDADESMDKVVSVFGDASQAVVDFSQTTADTMGLSAQDYQTMAAQSGALLQSMGISADDAAKSTEVMSQRAADLAAIYGGDASTAMADFDKAMTGQTRGLKKYGIVLSNAEIEQRAMNEGYVDAEGKVTDAGKAIAAQELILEKSSKQAGAFADNAGDLGSQQAIMAAKMENLSTTVGNMLLPVLEQLMTYLQPILQFMQDNITWIAPLVAAIAGLVVGVKAWAVAQTILNSSMLANPIFQVVAAVAALTAGIIWAYNNVGWFKDAVDAMARGVVAAFNWVKDAVMGVFNWVKDNWPLLLAILTGPFGLAVYTIQRNWDTIKAAAKAVWDWIKNTWSTIQGYITGPIERAVGIVQRSWDTIKNAASNTWSSIKTGISNMWEIISSPFRKGADFAKTFIEAIPRAIRNLVTDITNIMRGVADVVKRPFETAVNGVKSLWNRTVGGFGFSVPSWIPGMGGKSFKIPYMAAGGIVNRPTLALIGEAGPEAVIPLDQMGTATGEHTVVNINVYALTANAEVGRKVVEAIAEYERISGRRAV
jgi:phage-related protein